MDIIKIDLSMAPHWAVFAITGVLTIPPIELGLGPNVWLLPQPNTSTPGIDEIFAAVEESFRSFQLADHKHLTLGSIKVILIPMNSVSSKGVKVALNFADAALSIFNMKVPMMHTRLIAWHRRDGLAVGATFSDGLWTPLKQPNLSLGPGLVVRPPVTSWDGFLSELLAGKLSPLGVALSKCMGWNSEAQRTANIAHRFAFSWIGLESMLPSKEKDQAGSKKRFPILVGTTSKYYSSVLRADQKISKFLTSNPNPNGKLWRDEIGNMYNYRCEVFHEGVTDLTSSSVEPERADWYAKIADFLCHRVIMLAGMAYAENIETVEDFWESFVPRSLLSEQCQWFRAGVLFGEFIIKFDWRSDIYPEINRV